MIVTEAASIAKTEVTRAVSGERGGVVLEGDCVTVCVEISAMVVWMENEGGGGSGERCGRWL